MPQTMAEHIRDLLALVRYPATPPVSLDWCPQPSDPSDLVLLADWWRSLRLASVATAAIDPDPAATLIRRAGVVVGADAERILRDRLADVRDTLDAASEHPYFALPSAALPAILTYDLAESGLVIFRLAGIDRECHWYTPTDQLVGVRRSHVPPDHPLRLDLGAGEWFRLSGEDIAVLGPAIAGRPAWAYSLANCMPWSAYLRDRQGTQAPVRKVYREPSRS